jgi:hypothetical protein
LVITAARDPAASTNSDGTTNAAPTAAIANAAIKPSSQALRWTPWTRRLASSISAP